MGYGHPFLKWAGGKRRLIPDIMRILPTSLESYYEPFVGGGSLFFSLQHKVKHAYLSDINRPLITSYQMIRDNVDDVIAHLSRHRKNHSKAYYYAVRDKTFSEDEMSKVAADFIYLNKTCFNGLCRYNRKGKFNVPIGGYILPKIYDEENLRIVSKILKNVSITCCSFDEINPRKGDVIYCDPPYDGCYSSYVYDGFNKDDHKILRECCDKWLARGAYVVISNSNTDFVRETWDGYDMVEVTARRLINRDGDGRGKVVELLIFQQN